MTCKKGLEYRLIIFLHEHKYNTICEHSTRQQRTTRGCSTVLDEEVVGNDNRDNIDPKIEGGSAISRLKSLNLRYIILFIDKFESALLEAQGYFCGFYLRLFQ